MGSTDIGAIELSLGILGGVGLGAFTVTLVSFIRMFVDWTGNAARLLVLGVAAALSAIAVAQLYRETGTLDVETFALDIVPAWIAITVGTAIFAIGQYDGLIQPTVESRVMANVRARLVAAAEEYDPSRGDRVESGSRDSMAASMKAPSPAEVERASVPNRSPSSSPHGDI